MDNFDNVNEKKKEKEKLIPIKIISVWNKPFTWNSKFNH